MGAMHRRIRLAFLAVAALRSACCARLNSSKLRLDSTAAAGSKTVSMWTYFSEGDTNFTDAISLETICCLTQHDVDGTTGLPGAELVSDAKLVPATFTLKYHADLGAVKPYVGAGPAYFIWIDEQPGAATLPLGVTDFRMSDEFGIALQAGVDIPLNDSGLALSIDAKRYFIDTTARWYAGDTLAIQTEHKLDPWVIGAGIAWRF